MGFLTTVGLILYTSSTPLHAKESSDRDVDPQEFRRLWDQIGAADPTVAYALSHGDGGNGSARAPLSRNDLQFDHPYNTYRYGGLPPGPIANPGRAALEAVLNPLQTDEFYFVADGSGGHAFARSLAEHNRNVARWRAIQSQTKTE